MASNGDLEKAKERAEAAWAECAAVVDTVVACQKVDDEKAR